MKLHSGRTLPGWLGLSFWLACACPLFAQTLTLEEFLQKHPPDAEGYVHVEGDILIPLQALKIGRRTKATIATSFLECGCGFWDGGDVPYEFDDNVSAENRQRMRDAMAEWEAVANVHFRPKTWNDVIYTHIESSSEVNQSTIGRIDIPFANKIQITSWGDRFKIVHELGHCLGFWHEQSRSDRDTYVTINTANIEAGKEDNFDKHDRSDHYGPYDFDSVMHYDACAFSKYDSSCKCGDAATRTITVKPPWNTQWQCGDSGIGQRTHLSKFDALTMSFIYPYSSYRFVDGSYGGDEQGSFLKPYRTFSKGATEVPSGGTVWIQPGAYSAVGTYTKAMTLQAPLGEVTLQ